MNWHAIAAIASTVSIFASVATALYIRAEPKQAEKDRYPAVTSELSATREVIAFCACPDLPSRSMGLRECEAAVTEMQA